MNRWQFLTVYSLLMAIYWKGESFGGDVFLVMAFIAGFTALVKSSSPKKKRIWIERLPSSFHPRHRVGGVGVSEDPNDGWIEFMEVGKNDN